MLRGSGTYTPPPRGARGFGALAGIFDAHGWSGDAVHATAAGMKRPLIAVLNGPNLNLLGTREPALYGAATLDDVEALCAEVAEALDLAIDFRQTNGEGELISWVQECRDRAAGVIINPAGYGHTSIALMDALLALDCPIVEVHLTNIHRREPYRHHSYTSEAANGLICGFGARGYALALQAIAELLQEEAE